jgi:hypothetical protein
MTVAIMQPYFFPYVGYFQLIRSVDLFVIYDNLKYTKKGWINRNRILVNGTDEVFSLPLKGDSDFLQIRERSLAPDFDRDKLLNKIKSAYRKAPHFAQASQIIESITRFEDPSLFEFIRNSLKKVSEYLEISTPITISSGIAIDHELKGQDKVLAICQAVGASRYVNAIGGQELYSRDEFLARGVELKFIRSNSFEYRQFENPFVPWLSIVDVMMFNSQEVIRNYLASGYELI